MSRQTEARTEADARIAIDDRLRHAGWDPLDKSMVGTEVQMADASADDQVVDRFRARPFKTHAPVYDLVAAAGAFGPDRFNEENLRRAYRNPGGTLIDFNRAALGRLRIKSREEKIEETFRAWLVSRSLTPNQAAYLYLLKNRGIATGRVRLDDLFEPPLSILDAAGKGIELFGEQGLREVVDDLNAGVFDLAG